MVEYRDVPDFSDYEADSNGNVYSNRSKQRVKLKPIIRKQSRYPYIGLKKNNITSQIAIHKIITTTFFGSCPENLGVIHKDNNVFNNSVNNLEYSIGGDIGVEYKNILDYQDYRVGDDGSVWSKKNMVWERLKLIILKTGYPSVNLSKNGKTKVYCVHRLILFAFYGPPPDPKMETAHNNGIRTDNRLVNLRWATRTENHADKKLHGTCRFGESHSQSKLTDKKVRSILKKEFSNKEYATMYNVSASTISDIHRHETWKHIK